MSNVRFKETIQENIGGNGFGSGGGFASQASQAFAAGGLGSQASQAFGAAGFGGRGGNGGGGNGGSGGNGKHGFAHDLGEAVTRGAGGERGYLASYIKQLQSYPLRTKMLTSGGLAGLQELLASWIAQDRSRNGSYFTSRVPKMALYGALVSAPMGHFMIKFLQFLFAERTSLKSKIAQIVISNLIISPIQNTIYLFSMAIIAGARTFHQIRATIRAGFWPVMRVSWISSPLALAFAQQFLPPETWVPFFNFVAFCIGTYVNSHTKKKRLAALRRKRQEEGRDGSRDETYIRRDY